MERLKPFLSASLIDLKDCSISPFLTLNIALAWINTPSLKRDKVIGFKEFSWYVTHVKLFTLLSDLSPFMWSMQGLLSGLGIKVSATRRCINEDNLWYLFTSLH